ncbi:MAG TPA: hypothetical protein DCO70_03175 [Verrucomicrobiales bacterium]|nr:hypothetical protein [Verrucomicrobiales bacterium]|tara:strand:- start:904 stop:1632 length:729 start_codon:yes stop_codon:yes gene_type:complete
MKNLIAPVIVALLIVATLAIATKYVLMPAIKNYVDVEVTKIDEANAKLKAIQLVHDTTPGGRFKDEEFDEESIRKSAKELENFVSANRMTFDNPEIQTLMEELKRRLKNVRDREERVEQVQSQLESEWSNLATVTNRINQARLALSNKLESARSQIKETEMKQLKKTAAILTNMTPAEAIVSLDKTNHIESAKLLYYMQTPEQAKIISQLNKGTQQDKELVKKILEAFKRVDEYIPVEPDDK